MDTHHFEGHEAFLTTYIFFENNKILNHHQGHILKDRAFYV